MHEASQVLVGKHDFRSFESDWPNKATSVRTIRDISVRRFSQTSPLTPPGEDSELIALEVEADGFLYNMVRTITGTLVNVGRGTWTAGDVERVLNALDRNVAGATAPACGLFMLQVNYPDDLTQRQPKPE
jgi:tRNA pseudouridine38-40 synthase